VVQQPWMSLGGARNHLDILDHTTAIMFAAHATSDIANANHRAFRFSLYSE